MFRQIYNLLAKKEILTLKFIKMTIEQTKSIHLTDYLQSIGFAPCKQQNNNLWYLSPLRNENTPSFKVNLVRNQWYDFGIGKGGDIIALVMELHRTDVAGALRILDDKPIIKSSFSFRQQEIGRAHV